MALDALLEGFFLGISLIGAIGAQNLFVLRQGIHGSHLFLTAVLCSLCDSFLIGVGTLGAGSIIAGVPGLRKGAVILGTLFLIYYGCKSFLSVVRGKSVELLATPHGDVVEGQKQVILSALGFSLLNPQAFLDTIVLIGGLSGQYEFLDERFLFALGAIFASVVWFFSLVYGAHLIGPLFRNPRFAAMLDILVGVIMFWIAFTLFTSEIEIFPKPVLDENYPF